MKNEMKIKGLRNVCSLTKCLAHHINAGHCVELFFDTESHKCWGIYQVSCNTWTRYRDKSVIFCGAIQFPMTMDKIREIIEENLEMYTDPETLDD